MQNPLESNIYSESYEQFSHFINAENNIKQRNFNSFFANISQISPWGLIMSHNVFMKGLREVCL